MPYRVAKEREIGLIDCIGQASIQSAVSARQYYFKSFSDLLFIVCMYIRNTRFVYERTKCASPLLSLMGQNFSDATELSENQVQQR